MLSASEQLDWCLGVNIALIVVIVAVVAWFYDAGQQKGKYMSYGPSDRLEIVGVTVDTWEKYGWTLFVIAVMAVSDVIVNEFGMPLISFYVYNPDRTHVPEFSRNGLQFYTNTMYIVNAFKSLFTILVSVAQIDIAVFRVIVSELATFVTVRLLLNRKTFGH